MSEIKTLAKAYVKTLMANGDVCEEQAAAVEEDFETFMHHILAGKPALAVGSEMLEKPKSSTGQNPTTAQYSIGFGNPNYIELRGIISGMIAHMGNFIRMMYVQADTEDRRILASQMSSHVLDELHTMANDIFERRNELSIEPIEAPGIKA
jgi:hypothetical protein